MKLGAFFIKNPTNISMFDAASFYNAFKLMLTDLRELYLRPFVGEACLLPVVHSYEVTSDTGLSSSVQALLINNMSSLDYNLQYKKKRWKEKAAVQHRGLIPLVQKGIVPGDGGMKTVRDIIGATEEGHKLSPKRTRSESMLPGKEGCHGEEEVTDNEVLLVEP